MTRDDHQFCARCWGRLHFLAPPWCARCHVPFSVERGSDAQCARCIESPPQHAGVRAAVAYDDIARAVVLGLKYGGQIARARTIARAMERLVPDNAELLVPVPLHPWRLWRRGFNQAALIARALGRSCDVPVDAGLLRRIRATPPLGGLGAHARAQAVRGAFAVARGGAARVAGRSVVLIDDVHTSGATSDACTAVLLDAGAASVTILCWARVLHVIDGN